MYKKWGFKKRENFQDKYPSIEKWIREQDYPLYNQEDAARKTAKYILEELGVLKQVQWLRAIIEESLREKEWCMCCDETPDENGKCECIYELDETLEKLGVEK